ncbi:phage tail tape measure protein [Helicobacter salomonis]|uniref:phage tail tape measure protein n=1 Tax=Helicobacter salomonis TaxID=56878 RepID=UPI000CF0DDD2|nr:phage tail tape measure protein [Helicobacter salomonis]
MQTELSIRIRPQLDAFRESMSAARRALSLETSGGVVEGVQASMRSLRSSLNSSLRLGEVASTQVQAINAELRQVNTAVITQRFNESMNRIKESIGGVLATIGAATATLGKPIKASIDFEDSFASVKKVLDDATDPEKLKKGVLAMSVELGSATKDLNAILESAGQMGIKGDKDLLKFTETVQKMSVAFDMSADEAGKSMAQIQSVLNLSMDDMVMLGDTINHVSNNSTAKAADIIDMLKRLGGTGKDFFLVGKNFGFTAKQITGLGSAMIDLGMTPDVASTALSAVLNKLQAGGKPFKKWFEQMGLDFEEWSTQRAKNPEKALRVFFSHINQLEDQDKTNALKDMFGLEHLGKIKTLTGSLEKYDKVMQLATSNASKGSMDEEFAAKASTTAHQLKRLSAQMEVLYINLGDTMLPIINKFIGAFQAMLAPIANFAKEHKSATRAIMLTIAGVVGLKAAIIGLSILKPLAMMVFTPLLRAWTLMRYSVLGNIAALLWHRSVSFLSAAAMGIVRAPLLILGTTYRLLSGQITLSSVATRVFALTSMLAANIFGGAMKLMRLALITSGIGVLIAGLGVGVYALVNHWESVKAFLSQIWEGLRAKMASFWEALASVFGAIGSVLSPVVSVFSWVFELLGSGIVKLLNLFGVSVGSMSDVFKPLLELFAKIYEWYKGIFGGVLGKVADFLGFGGDDGSKNILTDTSKLSLPTLGMPADKQSAMPVLGSFDYSALGAQKTQQNTKTDSRSINSNNTQTINIYTQGDPNSIVSAIKQAGIGQYSYADEKE